MEQIYSEEDVIRFSYGEMADSEYEAFFRELCKNESLWGVYEDTQTLKNQLEDSVLLNPPLSIDNLILERAAEIAQEFRNSQDTKKVNYSPVILKIGVLTFSTLVFSWFLFSALSTRNISEFTSTATENDTEWIRKRIYNLDIQRSLPTPISDNGLFRTVRYGSNNSNSVRFSIPQASLK